MTQPRAWHTLPKSAELVADAISRRGPLSDEQVAGVLEVGKGRASKIARDLTDDDHQPFARAHARQAGLPPRAIKDLGRSRMVTLLEDRAGCAIGIDIGRCHAALGVGDPNGRLLPRAGEEREGLESIRSIVGVDGDAPPVETMRAIAETAVDQLAALEVDQSSVRATTMTFPAPVSTTGKFILIGSMFQEWYDEPLDRLLREALNRRGSFGRLKKVIVGNDADVLVRGEARFGEGYGYGDVVAVTASSGIGAGVIVNGAIVRNAAGGGIGEIGHCVVRSDGLEVGEAAGLIPIIENRRCSCGKRGHLEALAGGGAIVERLVASAAVGRIELPEELQDASESVGAKLDLVLACSEHNEACAAALADAGRMIGRGVHTLINLFNPELVLICGKLSEAGDSFLDAVRDGCREQGRLGNETKIELGSGPTTSLRRSIAIRGAIATALRNSHTLI